MAHKQKYLILEEILSQPRILENLLKKRPLIQKMMNHFGKVRRLFFTGCGDPFFASITAKILLEKATGLMVDAMRSMEMRWRQAVLGKDALVVASSVSGRTPRTIEAALLAKKSGSLVLAVTDNPGSPITHAADQVILTNTSPKECLTVHSYSGYQNLVPQTKTFTAVLLAQLLIGSCLIPEESERRACLSQLRKGPRLMQEFLKNRVQSIARMGKRLSSLKNFVILGSGPWFGTALYGFAKLLEYAIPSRYQCLEEYNHLEAFIASKSTCIIFLAPENLSSQRALELFSAYPVLGARTVVITNEPKRFGKHPHLVELPSTKGEWDMAFLAPVPLQILPLGIAIGKGRDPNQWLGGLRTDTILALSQKTIRGSRILCDEE